MISKEKKTAIMKEYARCEGDTGEKVYHGITTLAISLQ